MPYIENRAKSPHGSPEVFLFAEISYKRSTRRGNECFSQAEERSGNHKQIKVLEHRYQAEGDRAYEDPSTYQCFPPIFV